MDHCTILFAYLYKKESTVTDWRYVIKPDPRIRIHETEKSDPDPDKLAWIRGDPGRNYTTAWSL